jgi:DNA-binding CsgD family transcriptional regulator
VSAAQVLDAASVVRNATDESRAVLIAGPAGMGKTFRWNHLVQAADDAGWRVLRARPSQAERRLVGSALIDLCDGISDDELDELPASLATVLRAALLRGAPDATVEPEYLAFAFTSLVRRLAGTTPVAIAVDDIQWLDAQTEAVLSHAVRRLPAAGALVYAALRTGEGVAEPDLVTHLGELLLTRIDVPALDAVEIRKLIDAATPEPLSARAQWRVIALSAGNPLFAIELARSMVQRGVQDEDRPTLPTTLTALIGARLTELPAATRAALEAAAALRRPTLEHLSRLGLADELGPAERAAMVRVDGGAVEFVHPLYGAAAYDALVGTDRMRLHRRLADVVDGPEERARHLALGADRPDAEVAASLDEARERALRRGAIEAAVDAARLAVRASPVDDIAAAERRVVYGELLFRTGDTNTARTELVAVADAPAPPHVRARALLALSDVVAAVESWLAAIPLGEQALVLADGNPALQARILLAIAPRVADFSLPESIGYVDRALAIHESAPDPDPARLASALAFRAQVAALMGDGVDHDAFHRASTLQAAVPGIPINDRAVHSYAGSLECSDDLDLACQVAEQVLATAVEEGDEAILAGMAAMLARYEFRRGSWQSATDHAQQGLEAARRAALPVDVARCEYVLGLIRSAEGDLEFAVETAERVLLQFPGVGYFEGLSSSLIGYCRYQEANFEAAVEGLAVAVGRAERTQRWDPALRMWDEYYVEALIGVGRVHEAEEALSRYEERAQRLERRSALGKSARCRAVLLAAQGRSADALLAADEAVSLLDGLGVPFDHARAVLTKGQLHRRLKQKALAKQTLSAALAEFESLGAAGFAEKARAELSRVGLRPAAPTTLTETERKVAELAATGMTRQSIAAALFLSPHTVAANLTRVYRKLGASNRAELVARLAHDGATPSEEDRPS